MMRGCPTQSGIHRRHDDHHDDDHHDGDGADGHCNTDATIIAPPHYSMQHQHQQHPLLVVVVMIMIMISCSCSSIIPNGSLLPRAYAADVVCNGPVYLKAPADVTAISSCTIINGYISYTSLCLHLLILTCECICYL
jgi:hypothetical protein